MAKGNYLLGPNFWEVDVRLSDGGVGALSKVSETSKGEAALSTNAT